MSNQSSFKGNSGNSPSPRLRFQLRAGKALALTAGLVALLRREERGMLPMGSQPSLVSARGGSRGALNLDRAIFLFAGFVILLSVGLAHYFSQWWLLLTVFVGLNMIQAAFTGFCPAAFILTKLGLKSGCAFPPKK